MNRLYPIIICILISNLCLAQSSEELFQKATIALQNENYDGAIEIYDALLDQSKVSDNLFFNLGTAHLQKKQIGKAVLYLEKAIKLNPRNKDAQTNLTIAKSQIQNPIFEISPFFIKSFWDKLKHFLPLSVWAVFSLLCLAIFFFILNQYFFKGLKKKKAYIGLVLTTTFFLLTLSLSFSRYQEKISEQHAVVMRDMKRYTGPDRTSIDEEAEMLSSGIKVKMIESYEDWYKVKLPDSDECWIPNENLSTI